MNFSRSRKAEISKIPIIFQKILITRNDLERSNEVAENLKHLKPVNNPEEDEAKDLYSVNTTKITTNKPERKVW